LDWLLNESNLIKLLEGRYDNRPTPTQKTAAVTKTASASRSARPVRTFAQILEAHRHDGIFDENCSSIAGGEPLDGARAIGF
ncbi:MAG: hypothetical protein IJU31_06080, partial [Synergistaceae bacterium]|nr:hypothetical protein [Synergistaceae bacterium]